MKFGKKITAFTMAAVVAAPAVIVSAAPPREGEVDVNVGNQGVQVQVQRDEEAATQAVREGRKLGAYRSADLMDLTVKNSQGEDIGSIKDIVIATNTGKVRYAALSFGGFLGVGDKMFAIPIDSLQMMRSDDDTHFVLNVSQEKLEKAPGFDEDNWPNFADANVTGQIDAYYGPQAELRDPDADATRTDEPRTEAREADVNANDATEASPYASAMRVSQVKSLAVYDAADKNIAAIEDIVIDMDEGNVRYVAVSFDDSWGYGEKLFAMPWKALQFQHKDDETSIVLNVTQAQMKSATGFNDDDWPNFADPEWRKSTDAFYLNAPGVEVDVNR